MKQFAVVALTLLVIAPALRAEPRQAARGAQTQQRLQPGNNQPARPRAGAAAPAQNTNEELLQALYLSEFQRQLGISDQDVRTRFRPILMQWLQQRRNVVARRNEAVDTLRQLVASGAPVSEITRQITEVDQTENQTRNSERRLLNQMDPLLTPVQQAKLRIFQVDMEKRIRELLEQAQQQPPRGGGRNGR